MTQFNFRLSPQFLGDAVWRQIFENIEIEFPAARARIEDMSAACELTRASMAYATGSISLASALSLYGLVRFIRPQTIFEVGTFIGRSTLSMAAAMDANNAGGAIYTCDGSNDFMLPVDKVKCPITGYPKTMSHDALQRFVSEVRSIDLLHIDGRVSAADLNLIAQISNPRLVVALDDFEGFEKGVANYALMRAHPFFQRHILIEPISDRILTRMGDGFIMRGTMALFVPTASFALSSQ